MAQAENLNLTNNPDIMKMNLKSLALIVVLLASSVVGAQKQTPKNYPSKKAKSKDWVMMLDKDLSQWEVWTGVPDASIVDLPEGYKQEVDGTNKEAVGLGDPMGVYTITEDENGELVLNISGQIYAGLTSLETYSNYHMTLLFKWGEKKFAPRLDAKRDNGILYHCHGNHGRFWNVWKASLEYQIQEADFGDLYTLGGTTSKVRANDKNRWDPTSDNIKKNCKNALDAESPHGEWTRVDLYVVGDKAIHMTNGVVVLALKDAKSRDGKALTEGQIQIQCEGAEAYVKDICIRPITKFPKKLLKAANF